ncbi:MAG: DUF378 domain-containing protein [Candidatus Levybacteria bacterium]|nr:DUF378 domain-containing protein [Candidatus Levybacteria bacterium]
MKVLHMVSFALVIVGALNWGLVGLLKFNLVSAIFGSMGLENIIYILVGAAAVVVVLGHKKECKVCSAK